MLIVTQLLGVQPNPLSLNAFITIQSIAFGMLAIAAVLSVMFLVKNTAEKNLALASEQDLMMRRLIREVDGKRSPTIARDQFNPFWFAFYPFIVFTPAMLMFADLTFSLLVGISAMLLGLFMWWLIPRMPGSDTLLNMAYRVTMVALPALIVALGLGLMLAYTTGRPLWKDPLAGVVTVAAIVLYALYMGLSRTKRFYGEPATYLGLAGFVLVLISVGVSSAFS